MKFLITLLLILYGAADMTFAAEKYDHNGNMIVRISEIEVYPQYLDDYLGFATMVAETSVREEKGVISIYPMMKIEDNSQIRILEIYQDNEAYQKHIASKHFQEYKQKTLHMVKSLDLVDMYQISPTAFKNVFKKAK